MTTYHTTETHVDLSQNIRYWEGEGDTYIVKNRGELFRALRSSFGRCISKMYRGDGIEVGWVFVQRMVDDAHAYRATREVWVEVREAQEEE